MEALPETVSQETVGCMEAHPAADLLAEDLRAGEGPLEVDGLKADRHTEAPPEEDRHTAAGPQATHPSREGTTRKCTSTSS